MDRKRSGQTIGFVPTMGALHEGHFGLIRQASAESDFVVCSIFVNPTQFNQQADLEKYPRTLESDLRGLQKNGCQLAYTPSEFDIYPDGPRLVQIMPLGQIANVLEGAFRPGHFDGVVQVVKRLLDIVQPDKLFMGQKDFQQVAVVRSMIDYFNLNVKLISCETRREESGLAMSSRNRRLSPAELELAPKIYQTLQWVKDQWSERKLQRSEIENEAMRTLDRLGFRTEYLAIVNRNDLLAADQNQSSEQVCVAAWLGDVRLIDNIPL